MHAISAFNQNTQGGVEILALVIAVERISEEHEMIRAIDRNHERVTGKKPEREVVTWCSDASVLSRYGVETVNYGPSSGPRDEEGEKVRIQTLVEITKIYALIAAELCGVQT